MTNYKFKITVTTQDNETITAKSNVSAKKCDSYIKTKDDAGYTYIKFLNAVYRYFVDGREVESYDFFRY